MSATHAAGVKDYLSALPASSRRHLRGQLDWDSEGEDRDLNEIAHYMLGWEERLSSGLELTPADVRDITTVQPSKPEVQR